MIKLIKNIFFIVFIHNAITKKPVGISYFFLSLLVSVCISSVGMAANIVLKSGKTLQGSILEMDEETLTLQDEKGQKSQVIRSLIESIDFSESTESKPSQANAQKDTGSITKQDPVLPPVDTESNSVPDKLVESHNLTLKAPTQEDIDLFERVFNGPDAGELKKGPFASPKHTFETWRRASVKGDIKAMVKCYASFRKKEVHKQLKKIPRKKRKEMQEVSNETMFSLGEVYYQGNRASMEVTWNHGLKSDTQTLKFILENQQWKLIQ